MNLNENQVQIIDSLKTEFLRINETNKQHKVGTLIDFNQMANDFEEMLKKRDEDIAISKANKSRCEEEFYKAIDKLNEDLKYVGLGFCRDLAYNNTAKCETYSVSRSRYFYVNIELRIDGHTVDYGDYFEPKYYHLDTFRFIWEGSNSRSFDTIEELANSGPFVQFVKRYGDFDFIDKEVSHV